MAIDLQPLWDFRQPVISEARFRDALATVTGDDALILHTQIARTYGLRKDFEMARQILAAIATEVASAGPEARARHALESGRAYASATHTSEQQTPESRDIARAHFEAALAIARAGQLDDLAIDAIHMMAFVDTAPMDQVRWAEEALAVVERSTQPKAKKWEATIRNNLGCALHSVGRFDAALEQFEAALVLRERAADPGATRIARWMIAWTLRAMKRTDEALAIQLRLETENDAAGTPDPYVFEELEALFREKNDEERARYYAERKGAAGT